MFRANDIDIELLGRLTNDDLKDIGVASFGHRKKMLEAIAALVAAPEAPSRTPVPRAGAEDPGHRRAPPSHCDVFGPCRINCIINPYGP
jgi:hypothetical protein